MSHPEKHAASSGTGGGDSEKIGLVVDGRYRIETLLGRGGMGTVYRAEHVGIGRTVAVKLLHPTLAQVPEIAKRFEREALAIGRIEHPNCVDVSDSGRIEDGSLFLVMEYLEGQSAGDMMADAGRIDPRRALHITRHVLRGLAHAHSADIVHRDIKPENIFVVDQDGDPDFAKILDFGIAKLLGSAEKDEVKLTQAGVAFGTPIYMSPEQAVGNPVDGRADLYATTIVLYEMLTGKPPFYSDDKIEVLSMHTTRPPPAFEEIAPGAGIHPAIEALVQRGLAKRPGDRFADADAYIAAIDETLAELDRSRPARSSAVIKRVHTAPVVYGPNRVETVYPEPPSKRRALVMLGAVAGLVALAIGVALFAGGKRSDATEAAPAAELSPSDRANQLLAEGNPGAAINLLETQIDSLADDPEAQLRLGHAYATSDRPRDALRAYERAITLDKNTANDPAVRVNLQALLIAKDADVALDAADVLLSRMQDDVAATHLVELASRGKDLRSRHRARALAEKHALLTRVDWVASYALDLQDGAKCEERRATVLALRELGDARAIPALKSARIRRSKSRRYRGKNINACLRKDAEAAITWLTKKAAADKKAAAEKAAAEKAAAKKAATDQATTGGER